MGTFITVGTVWPSTCGDVLFCGVSCADRTVVVPTACAPLTAMPTSYTRPMIKQNIMYRARAWRIMSVIVAGMVKDRLVLVAPARAFLSAPRCLSPRPTPRDGAMEPEVGN